MAVKHLVIHECDLCGKHIKPSETVKVSVGFDKFDACGNCTTRVRLLLEELMAASITNEEEES